MLKAAIVYLQGSGGNLLSRTLALSEQTVAYLPRAQAEQQPTTTINARDRLQLYNNWNSKNWPGSEEELAIWYRHGRQDFCNYETTDLWLIDQFHPAMFDTELENSVLFNNISAWEHLIFVQWEPDNLDTIRRLAKLKRTDMNHLTQIDHNELPIFKKLIQRYPAHTVKWEHLLAEASYINAIEDLAEKLNLILDFDLVRILWQSWKTETDKILNE